QDRERQQAEDAQRREAAALEAFEQMTDAQRFAAREREASEHDAAGEHRRQQRMREAADDRNEHERDRHDDEDDENADPYGRRGAEDAPAFAPPSRAFAGGEVARRRRGRPAARRAYRSRLRLRNFHAPSLPKAISLLPAVARHS